MIGSPAPTHSHRFVLETAPAKPCPRPHPSGVMMEIYAKLGWLRPTVIVMGGRVLHVWIGDPREPGPDMVRPVEIIVPWARWRGSWKRAARFIRGHHKYWGLQARAVGRLCGEAGK